MKLTGEMPPVAMSGIHTGTDSFTDSLTHIHQQTMRGNNKPESERGAEAAMLRGLEAQDNFQKMFPRGMQIATKLQDMHEHWDLAVKLDVKKIRSVDDFGESNYHWLEIYNVNGESGWMFGQADYVSFETLRYWIIVSLPKLREWYKTVEIKEYADKKLYHWYRREGRKDKLIPVSTLDLAFLGFMVEKID